MSFRTPYRLVPLPSLETYLKLKDNLTFLLGPSKSHSTFPLWCGLAFSFEGIFYLLAPRASQTKLIIETEKLNLLCFQDVTKSSYYYLFNSLTRLFNCHALTQWDRWNCEQHHLVVFFCKTSCRYLKTASFDLKTGKYRVATSNKRLPDHFSFQKPLCISQGNLPIAKASILQNPFYFGINFWAIFLCVTKIALYLTLKVSP